MSETTISDSERRYRTGLLAMRGGVVVAGLIVLLLPPNELAIGLFLLACLGVAWGAWQRRRYCPARRGADGSEP
jgi:hypothetical protein